MKRLFAHRRGNSRGAHPRQEAKHRVLPWVALALTAALLVAGSLMGRGPAQGAASDAGTTPAGSAQNGKQVFMNKGCFACHGADAQGTKRTQPPGVRIGPPTFTYAFFSRYVRQPTGQMPAFAAAALSNAQLADLYAFLKTVPAPAEPGGAPSGSVENGKRLFVRDGCYECHGREGQGSLQTRASQIGPPPFPFSAFLAYVRHPSGTMPPYAAKVVSDAEMADIYAFLKSIPMPPRAASIPLLNQ